MNVREIENLLIRLNKVSSDMTKSVNAKGSITKKQIKEQETVVNELSRKLGLDREYLLEEMNK